MKLKRIGYLIATVVLALALSGCGLSSAFENSIEEGLSEIIGEIAENETEETTQETTRETTREATRETTTIPETTTEPEKYVRVVYYGEIVDYLPRSEFFDEADWIRDSGIWDYTFDAADKFNTYVADADYFLAENATPYVGTELSRAAYYGYYVDIQETHDRIFNAMLTGNDETVYVAWCGIPSAVQGWENPPSTYIAINIDCQFLWFFSDGYLLECSNVVTGLPTASRATPYGVFNVLNMGRNVNLKGEMDGEKWDSFVNYWMGITSDAVGIHDASWRGTTQGGFGGSIYEYNGSHGCINVPYYEMQTIYNNSYVGLTVIIY